MSFETNRMGESSLIGAGVATHEPVRWRCNWRVEKYHGDPVSFNPDGSPVFDAAPYEVLEREGNLLTTNGANTLWSALTGGAITAFNSTNTYIGVGDSTTAAAAAQTDLQAATNKFRKQVSGAPTVSTNTCQWAATFATGDANFAWEEWGVFNASSGGTMLNRKVESLGTKTSSSTWTFTVTLSLA